MMGTIVTYPAPNPTKILKKTIGFVEKLRVAKVITESQAREWKQNLYSDYELEKTRNI